MKFMALIYSAEPTTEPSMEEIGEEIAKYQAFQDKHGAHLGDGEALEPSMAATTVRVRDGEATTTDGPFAETKEVLGGFYILDCADIDQACKVAADIPGAAHGCVEVRPVMDIPEG